MPITPFIGVRTSWLILARNSLLARLQFGLDLLPFRDVANDPPTAEATENTHKQAKHDLPCNHKGDLAPCVGTQQLNRLVGRHLDGIAQLQEFSEPDGVCGTVRGES